MFNKKWERIETIIAQMLNSEHEEDVFISLYNYLSDGQIEAEGSHTVIEFPSFINSHGKPMRKAEFSRAEIKPIPRNWWLSESGLLLKPLDLFAALAHCPYSCFEAYQALINNFKGIKSDLVYSEKKETVFFKEKIPYKDEIDCYMVNPEEYREKFEAIYPDYRLQILAYTGSNMQGGDYKRHICTNIFLNCNQLSALLRDNKPRTKMRDAILDAVKEIWPNGIPKVLIQKDRDLAIGKWFKSRSRTAPSYKTIQRAIKELS